MAGEVGSPLLKDILQSTEEYSSGTLVFFR
jgi:hypothetical protein